MYIPKPIVAPSLGAQNLKTTDLDRLPSALVSLENAQQRLQSWLQQCLDHQAAGLVAGLSAMNGDTFKHASTVSHSPEEAVPLGQARREIYRTTKQLIRVKEEEKQYFSLHGSKLWSDLSSIDGWTKKRADLMREMSSVQPEDASNSLANLVEEELALQDQIQAMDTKLAELKSRLRSVRSRKAHSANAAESKTASYKASLSLLDSEIASFLKQKPKHFMKPTDLQRHFSRLPSERRTLEMARGYSLDLAQRAQSREAEAEVEQQALREGAELWRQLMTNITDFEHLLQSQTEKLMPTDGPFQEEENIDTSNDPNYLLENMDEVIEKLVSHRLYPLLLVYQITLTVGVQQRGLKHAEEADWSLMKCCIGAELEAFRQGRQILDQITQVTRSEPASARNSTGQLDTVRSSSTSARHGKEESGDKADSEEEQNPETLLISTSVADAG